MVNNGDVQIEKPSERLIRRVRLKAALHRMVSVRHQSTARAIREQMKPMLSNGSRGNLMSHTDHSVQLRL